MIVADITNRMSPNFRPGTPNGKIVIVHATRSDVEPLFPKEFDATLNTFANAPGPSSHWVVARDGRTARCVLDTNCAQHAIEHNVQAWGIELEQAKEDDGFTDVQIASLVAICKGYVEDFGVAPAHTSSMNASGFIGHEETPQGIRAGKTDPGRHFDWPRFISLLTEQGDADMPMRTHSKVADWWVLRTIDPTPERGGNFFTMQAAQDFELPANATRVRFGVYLSSGPGHLRFFNADGSEAEPVGWGRAPMFGSVEVTLSPGGTVPFRVEGGPITTNQLRCLVFWT